MKKIYILDSVNYLFRSYYAIGPMTNKNGESTSALYGFIRSVKKLINDFSPKYLICVFDGPNNKQSRLDLFEDYKAHRTKAPDDLYPQIDMAIAFCKIAGIPTITVPNVEADDTMATIALWAEKNNMQADLCTSDKDLFQLVNDNIKVINAHKNNLLYDYDKVMEVYGISPKQMLDYLAIVGDTADNIPGIEGFGPKTATALLQEFETLENIYANLDKISSEKKRDALITQKDKAFLSKKLATLQINVPIFKNKSDYLLKEPDIDKLEEFYKKMHFMTLIKDLKTESQKEAPIAHNHDKKYKLINSIEDLNKLIEILKKEKDIAIDTETTGIRPLLAEIVGVGFSVKAKEAYYIPFNGNIEKELILEKIKDLLEDENRSFYGHNLKYDYHIFLNYGIKIKNISFDTILASYLLNPQNRRHNIDVLTLDLFGINKISIKDLIGTGKKEISMADVDIEKVSEYCCEDVDFTCRLKKIFEKQIKEKDLEALLYDIELPLLKILAHMERSGIYLDTTKLTEMSIVLNKQLKEVEGEIYSEVGREFNINSPKQLGQILYEELKVPPPRKKNSSYSTAANVLEKLAGTSPFVSNILKYRGLKKLLSTYVDAIPKLINPKTKRVHPTFNQSVTATGRLSCQDPNLQNIPIRSDEGKKIREGFKPEKNGWSYIAADYSQIELRLLAHFSEDPELLKAFNSNKDIHAYTASLVYKVPIDEVTKKMRYTAKAVNFGILYGQGPYGLSEQIGISKKDASEFIKAYFERYPKVKGYLEQCKIDVEQTQIAYTLLKRQRPIPEINNPNPMVRAAAQRLAVNTPLQGTAADLIKLAMIEIDREFKKKSYDGFMILQVHDELIFEVPDSEIAELQDLIKNKMETVFQLKVPLVVDIEVGKNWGEC